MMNFLLRTVNPSTSDLPSILEQSADVQSSPKPVTTLEGLISEDGFSEASLVEEVDPDDSEGRVTSASGTPCSRDRPPMSGKHLDVNDDEGCITIPYKALPDNWTDATDILSLRALDRAFIFPGEQLHVMVCLSAPKPSTDVITPFRVAAVMIKNGIREGNLEQLTEVMATEQTSVKEKENSSGKNYISDNQNVENSGEKMPNSGKVNVKQGISASETLLRLEDHKKQSETLLERFKKSHFFVRIAESDEPLWSKRNIVESSPKFEATVGPFNKSNLGLSKASGGNSHLNAFVDRGVFDANASGGMARNCVKCCSLSNGDIVVVLQVDVGISLIKDPVLEILEFEKYQACYKPSANCDQIADVNRNDPCRELLTWLLPLDRNLSPPPRPVSPRPLSSTSLKSTFSSSSGSHLFSLSNFRSQSMPVQSQTAVPSSPVVSSVKPSLELEDWDLITSENFGKLHEAGNQGLLSFRGISLEPERFSVHCGLEGIYIPGRRWRRKLEVIQPIEIHSFAADCNTEDLLCVQIKNVSPEHIRDVLIFIDSITIVFEKAPKGGPPLSLPLACIEAGIDHSLPNLVLRRGEEHSFILKPTSMVGRDLKAHGERTSQLSRIANGALNLHSISKVSEGVSTSGDQYAILVSCRCNYTESKLFFKQATSWQPRATRDLMISVSSEMCKQTFGPNNGISQLPVQVLTLQASNLTSEDLTLTVLAPASFMSPPSVVSLNSAPPSPVSPFVGFAEFTARIGVERCNASVYGLNSSSVAPVDSQQDSVGEIASPSDVIPAAGFGCTHLWLQSTVPLGCIPSKSTATVKLELLPLTDGIITLDTLQISVKEKGITYIPECTLKINATSSIATVFI